MAATAYSTVSSKQDLRTGLVLLQSARAAVLQAKDWSLQRATTASSSSSYYLNSNITGIGVPAFVDCAQLYEESDSRLAHLISTNSMTSSSDNDDRLAWLSGVLTNHRTCLDGLGYDPKIFIGAHNLTRLLNDALAYYYVYVENALRLDELDERAAVSKGFRYRHKYRRQKEVADQRPGQGILASWNPASSRVDVVVAKDGSGDYRTVMDAVASLTKRNLIATSSRARSRSSVLIVYVKEGIYHEHVVIGRHLNHLMFVGDGIDRTIITGSRNAIDGHSTLSSATFSVSGDGFWARDITFENTAGPHKHQAVALMVASDHSVFYRCSFKGYQDTLYAHSLRQFYRDCQIHGTIDFIFGNAAVVLQNCDIFVRKPMQHQSNMITAQGRESPHENTGISIHGSRIRAVPDFSRVKESYRSFLGRPWKKYSRTVIWKTDIDGLVDPRGWKEWEGGFALSTLFYAEYMNTGAGSSTNMRVKWPGYHVLHNPGDVSPFTVKNFIQGCVWILRT
ncbi:putative pectinesterase/pectinesterase inhibitor 36, partial [Drosera capensis]